MRQVPFTLHLKIVPARPGKRMELIRETGRIAGLVYDALLTVSSITIAIPGGSAERSQTGGVNSSYSGLVNACAHKPQFGNTPAQLMITGFHEVSGNNDQVYQSHDVAYNDEFRSGYSAASAILNPTTTVGTNVKALKTAVEVALTAELPTDINWLVFRIQYNGITFGDRGYHFPRS